MFFSAGVQRTIIRMCARGLQKKSQRGFTLVELMVTVALVAIAMTLAVPSFRSLIANNRMAVQVNTLMADLNLARSAAVTRRQPVSLCPDDTGTTGLDCSGGTDWHTGYLVFADPDGDGDLASDADVIRVSQGSGDSLTTITGEESSVRYLPSGSACPPNALNSRCSAPNDTNDNDEITFQFRDSTGTASARDVDINPPGRASCSRQCPDSSWVSCSAQCP